MIQDQMLDHYVDKFKSEGILCLSSYINFLSNIWKSKHYLNVGKHVGVIGDYGKGFMDFTEWKHDNKSK